MKFILTTSDLYRNVVADQARLFNNFCEVKKEVTVLGFAPPTVELPENYKFASMGNQEDFAPREWVGAIRPFIEQIEGEEFAMLWDDLFPIMNFNETLLEEAKREVRENDVRRVLFHCGSREQYLSSQRYTESFNLLSQDAPYRSGLAPGIWNKQYFLDHLGTNISSWDFEINNHEKMKNDGAKMLLCKGPPICEWFNVIRKGKFHSLHWEKYKNSETGHFGWHRWMRLDKDTAALIQKYENERLW